MDAFSKKIENHAHAMSLHFMYYNFVRIHKTLWVTPAMAVGVSDRLWGLGGIGALIEAEQAKLPTKRGRARSGWPSQSRPPSSRDNAAFLGNYGR